MDWAKARVLMVEGQVRPNKVTDPRIVEAMLELPREAMVPAARRAMACADVPVPVAPGRALLAPMVVARLVQEARPIPGERVLALPGVAGYGAALLARLGLNVTLLETEAHATQAVSAMRAVGCQVRHVVGRLAEGAAAQGPYDIILIEGALPAPPQALLEQLSEGGRLLGIMAPRQAGQKVAAGTRQAFRADRAGGSTTLRPIFDAAAPDLPEFEAEAAFTL